MSNVPIAIPTPNPIAVPTPGSTRVPKNAPQISPAGLNVPPSDAAKEPAQTQSTMASAAAVAKIGIAVYPKVTASAFPLHYF